LGDGPTIIGLTTDEGFGLIGCRGPKFKDIDDATDDGRADEML
jgi:hypothetical protein